MWSCRREGPSLATIACRLSAEPRTRCGTAVDTRRCQGPSRRRCRRPARSGSCARACRRIIITTTTSSNNNSNSKTTTAASTAPPPSNAAVLLLIRRALGGGKTYPLAALLGMISSHEAHYDRRPEETARRHLHVQRGHGRQSRRQTAVRDARRRHDHRPRRWRLPLGDAAPADTDLIEIAEHVPLATLCLETALARHGLIDAIPAAIDIAIPRGSRRPALQSPARLHQFDAGTFELGRETSMSARDAPSVSTLRSARSSTSSGCDTWKAAMSPGGPAPMAAHAGSEPCPAHHSCRKLLPGRTRAAQSA